MKLHLTFFVALALLHTSAFALQSEATRNLESDETSAFALLEVGQLFKVGSQIMQARIGVRHWYETETFGPEGTTLSARLFFLFPK